MYVKIKDWLKHSEEQLARFFFNATQVHKSSLNFHQNVKIFLCPFTYSPYTKTSLSTGEEKKTVCWGITCIAAQRAWSALGHILPFRLWGICSALPTQTTWVQRQLWLSESMEGLHYRKATSMGKWAGLFQVTFFHTHTFKEKIQDTQ